MPQTNGKIEIPKPPRAARAAVDEQTVADSEQTLADADQTLSDADQSGSDRDQTSADCDQLASDRDQAASDRDLADGGDAEEHDSSQEIRQRSTRQRDQTSANRMDTANQRDATADARDVAALARDQAATARDLAMTARDASYEQFDGVRMVTGTETVVPAAGQRTQSAQQRELAAADREAAAVDRDAAARERRRALLDREAFARALSASESDPLTAARTRRAGLSDLDREVDRCRRIGCCLVVAYVDVVGLKALNHSEGHAAGDELLKRVVVTIQGHLRSYDLIVRLGGDEFLCVMAAMTLADARERFSQVAGSLGSSPHAGSIRTGFAELLRDDDGADELIARADSELLDRRPERNPSRARLTGDPRAGEMG